MDAPEVRPSHDPEHYAAHYYDAPEVLPDPPTKSNALHTYEYEIPETKEIPKRKDFLGLKPKSFWILLVVLIVVVAAAVGGGVGGGLAGQKKSSSPSSPSSSTSTLTQAQSSTHSATTPTSGTSTASSTSSAAIAGPSSGCNATDGKIYTPLDTSASNAPFSINGTTLTYKIYCNTNFASKSSGINPNISEILRQEDIASLDDCTTLCAAYNKALANPTPNTLCSVPVYMGSTNVTSCFLQSGNVQGATNVLFGPGQEFDSAVLQFPGLSCLSAHYGFANTKEENRVGECNLCGTGGVAGTPTGIHPDFVAIVADRSKVPVPGIQATDNCPALGTDGTQKRSEGSVIFSFYCGKYMVGAGTYVKPAYKTTLQQCVKDCAGIPSCLSSHYGFANTRGENRVGECNLWGTGGVAGTPTGIHPDFIAIVADRSKVPVAAMQTSDNCPGLGTNGLRLRESNVDFAFWCGKYVTNYGSFAKPQYKTNTLYDCVKDCAALPTCVSLHFGLIGFNSLGQNRQGECNLWTAGLGIPQGVHADFIAVVADRSRALITQP